MTKYLILSSIAVLAIVSFAGCASDEKQSSSTTTESSAATMAPDSKAMTQPGSTNSH